MEISEMHIIKYDASNFKFQLYNNQSRKKHAYTQRKRETTNWVPIKPLPTRKFNKNKLFLVKETVCTLRFFPFNKISRLTITNC